MSDSEPRTGPDAHPHGHGCLLLLARHSDEGAAAYCRDHVVPGPDSDSAWIAVLTDSPAASRARDFAGAGRPGTVVAVGDLKRSAAEGAVPANEGSTEVVVETGELGSVGRAVDDYLVSWSEAGHRPILCVDSLSGLLAHGSIKSAYRFLFVLHRRVREAGGAIHVHADPGVHEEEILRTFFSLFDRVISFQDGRAGRP